MKHPIDDQYLIDALRASVQAKQEIIDSFVKDNLLLEQKILQLKKELEEYHT